MDPLLERVAEIRPALLLDVGCGCGTFTKKLAEHCGQIVAVDHSPAIVERARRENGAANIEYLCADARRLPMADRSIDIVIERGSLHHVREWDVMLSEMVRVASQRVLALEPVDDPRSDGKRAAIAAHHFFLEIQAEVGYAHFKHLTPDQLETWGREQMLTVAQRHIRIDRDISYEDYFEPFEQFANRSTRRDYWLERYAQFVEQWRPLGLQADDLLLVEIE